MKYITFKQLLDSVSEHDEYGFWIRHYFHWRPESTEHEIKRLEYNLAIYKEFIKCGQKFPSEVNEERLNDFNRLRDLKGVQ